MLNSINIWAKLVVKKNLEKYNNNKLIFLNLKLDIIIYLEPYLNLKMFNVYLTRTNNFVISRTAQAPIANNIAIGWLPH